MSYFFHLSKLLGTFLSRAIFLGLALGLFSYSAQADKFDMLTSEARGQTVYFNAWGGSPQINLSLIHI